MPLPMTRPNRHRIQRQIVDLAIGDSAASPMVHRELARPFWDRAVPELERVFDSVAGPHELLRLDRLEIDLGRFDGARWPIEFRTKLVAELARSLAQFTPVADVQNGNARDPQRGEPWREFLFFLSHGYLPWWSAKPGDGWTETLLNRLDAVGWSALRDAVAGDLRARVRFVQSVSDEFMDSAIGKWADVRHAARVLKHGAPTSSRVDAHQQWRRAFWMTVLDWVFTGGPRSARGGLQLVRDLLTLHRTYVSDQRRGRLQSSSNDAGDGDEPIWLAHDGALPSPWREWSSQVSAVPFERSEPETHPDARTPSGDVRAASVARRAAPDMMHGPAEDETIYLDGAGAVLLHPFLEQLFRDRGVLAERRFHDAVARNRAVHLLGLLMFGSEGLREYDLVLAKVLCGLALEEPLEPVQLDNDDVAACDAVVRAVLEHWTALRSSSPEWLRQQFLLRNGKLESVDAGYLLTIERRAQDVLLARLPWGLGVVGLPWLADRIFVRWRD